MHPPWTLFLFAIKLIPCIAPEQMQTLILSHISSSDISLSTYPNSCLCLLMTQVSELKAGNYCPT